MADGRRSWRQLAPGEPLKSRPSLEKAPRALSSANPPENALAEGGAVGLTTEAAGSTSTGAARQRLLARSGVSSDRPPGSANLKTYIRATQPHGLTTLPFGRRRPEFLASQAEASQEAPRKARGHGTPALLKSGHRDRAWTSARGGIADWRGGLIVREAKAVVPSISGKPARTRRWRASGRSRMPWYARRRMRRTQRPQDRGEKKPGPLPRHLEAGAQPLTSSPGRGIQVSLATRLATANARAMTIKLAPPADGAHPPSSRAVERARTSPGLRISKNGDVSECPAGPSALQWRYRSAGNRRRRCARRGSP